MPTNYISVKISHSPKKDLSLSPVPFPEHLLNVRLPKKEENTYRQVKYND
jgi:hypothetical protein